MASILVTDLFARKSSRMKQSRTNLLVTRGTILVILMAAAVVAILVPGAMINDFGFLSMGLRGAVVFLPMCGGLWLKGKIPRGFALASIFAGPIAVLAGNFMDLPFDPLFLGMAVCLSILAVGLAREDPSKRFFVHTLTCNRRRLRPGTAAAGGGAARRKDRWLGRTPAKLPVSR